MSIAMDIKNKRYELRLSEREMDALDRLVEHDGLTDRAKWVAGQIRKVAKRKKVWK